MTLDKIVEVFRGRMPPELQSSLASNDKDHIMTALSWALEREGWRLVFPSFQSTDPIEVFAIEERGVIKGLGYIDVPGKQRENFHEWYNSQDPVRARIFSSGQDIYRLAGMAQRGIASFYRRNLHSIQRGDFNSVRNSVRNTDIIDEEYSISDVFSGPPDEFYVGLANPLLDAGWERVLTDKGNNVNVYAALKGNQIVGIGYSVTQGGWIQVFVGSQNENETKRLTKLAKDVLAPKLSSSGIELLKMTSDYVMTPGLVFD